MPPDPSAWAEGPYRRPQDHSYPGIVDGRVLVDVVTEGALAQLALDVVSSAGGMITEGIDAARQAAVDVQAAQLPRRIR